ncbi:MAG TPA: phosphopyruvate hydratase [Acidimicrobiales bacterium]|nr:phosphopyruvate hydratase [Acidimicrobiales bacterium]
MTVHEIAEVHATEILDSRGRPTVEVTVVLASGERATAGVPSGASTGRAEAVERRDGDPARYGGAGVLGAVANIETEIAETVCGAAWESLRDLDQALCDLDGTPDKGRIGANAIVGVSMAAARAFASAEARPLYDWLMPAAVSARVPVPHFNVLNGGAHAQNGLAFQEFMVAPVGAPNFREALRAGAEVYAALRARLHAAGLSTGLGDEGGFAPEVALPEDALALLAGAISDAGYEAGRAGVAIALDPAASGFRGEDGRYDVGDARLSSTELVERYAEIVDRFPVWSIEDGLGEDDWEGWSTLTRRLGDRVQIVGDDIFVTNPSIISRGIDAGVANAALIKLNQIGTVSETLEAMRVCRSAGYAQMISHRSGETTDAFIADLAVATGCGQIKSGAPARGERVAKYNRLTAIEAAAPRLPFGLT